MKRLKEARLFLEPVDPVKFNIPDYLTVIKRPMDLSTVEKSLAAQQYHTVEEFSDLVVYAASPRSKHLTGEIIVCDGGYSRLDRVLTS